MQIAKPSCLAKKIHREAGTPDHQSHPNLRQQKEANQILFELPEKNQTQVPVSTNHSLLLFLRQVLPNKKKMRGNDRASPCRRVPCFAATFRSTICIALLSSPPS